MKKSLKNFSIKWLPSMIIASGVLYFINGQIGASPEPTRQELESQINAGKVTVSAESVDGYQQIYYTYDNIQVFITDGMRNHTKPTISGRTVAWEETIDGFPQIVVYDLLDKIKTQVTQTGTNLSPSLSGTRVVWEGLFEGVGQIFYFDGVEFRQLSSGNLSLRPSIKDSQVIYAQYLGTGNDWQVLSQDITTTNPPAVVKQGGESDSWPKFVGDNIQTTP